MPRSKRGSAKCGSGLDRCRPPVVPMSDVSGSSSSCRDAARIAKNLDLDARDPVDYRLIPKIVETRVGNRCDCGEWIRVNARGRSPFENRSWETSFIELHDNAVSKISVSRIDRIAFRGYYRAKLPDAFVLLRRCFPSRYEDRVANFGLSADKERRILRNSAPRQVKKSIRYSLPHARDPRPRARTARLVTAT